MAFRGMNVGKSPPSSGLPPTPPPSHTPHPQYPAPSRWLSFLPALPAGSARHGKAAGRRVTRTLPGLGRARHRLRCPFSFPEPRTGPLGEECRGNCV